MKPTVDVPTIFKSHTGLRLIWGFAGLLLLLTWFAVGYKIETEKTAEVAAINRSNLNLTRTLEEHTLRTLKSVDQVVLFLKFQYEKSRGKDIRIADYVQEGMIISNLFNQIGVIDEHGAYILSNLPNHKVVDLSDREHFRVHQTHDCACLNISKPVLGRASGKWSLQLTRRINKPDGSFGGVVVVSLDPFYFTTLYAGVDVGNQGSVALVGDDGVVRARRSGQQITSAQSLVASPLLQAAHDQPVGVLSFRSQIDGVTRFYAFRRVNGFPLVVIVGIEEQEALDEVRQRATTYVAFGVLVSVIILGFAWTSTSLLGKLERSRIKAEESNRLKSEFLASMSHELRTPLNGIVGYSELLRDELKDPEQKEFADTIYSSSTHLLTLLNSILDLAKIEAGHLQVTRSLQDIRQLLRQVCLTHLPEARAKGLEIHLDMDDAVPHKLWFDAMRLAQVLNNLLHNAVKFTLEGQITLKVTRLSNSVMFVVKDTGPGISEEDQAVIFDKFRQAEHFDNRHHVGAGLGLALSRQLVERMGGHLTVRSALGQGSEFSFSLPVSEEDAV